MKRVLPPLIASLIFFTALLPATAATITQRATSATHVVQQGDTLYAIARRYGTTIDELRLANGLNSDIIWVGQVLLVGSATVPGHTTHTVVAGDTLYSLARRYGTTVKAIMQVNHLTSTNIYVGQSLRMASSSAPPVGSTVYTIVHGDTLYSIARRYGTTVEAIMAANKLSSTLIYIGQRLLIAPTAPVPTVTPIPTATSTPTGTLTPTASPPICDPSYPDFCLEPGIPDLNCEDIPQYARFRVLPPDPHGFDGNDNDGVGCEDN